MALPVRLDRKVLPARMELTVLRVLLGLLDLLVHRDPQARMEQLVRRALLGRPALQDRKVLPAPPVLLVHLARLARPALPVLRDLLA